MKFNKETIALGVAYVLLVLVVVWVSFDIQRTLDTMDDRACVTAEMSILSEIGILGVFGNQEGVDEELRDRLKKAFYSFQEAIIENCPAFQNLDSVLEE